MRSAEHRVGRWALYNFSSWEIIMRDSITGTFATRRDADMAVERLVQEFGLERTDIFVATDGDDNSAGIEPAGADQESAEPSVEAREDGAYGSGVTVSVDVNDEKLLDKIRDAFAEFDGITKAG